MQASPTHPFTGDIIMARNSLREHKVILYRLKRNFGARVVFSKPIENENNVMTGEITRTYLDIIVRRAIVLPSNLERTFAYDLTYIASNKNFVYGAMFDKNKRNMIVQKKDLKGWTPELDWKCLYKNRDYSINDMDETEDGAGYIFACNALDADADTE
jgi:hypothetical protein